MTRICCALLTLLTVLGPSIAADAGARIRLLVPADAVVVIDGEATTATGMDRLFETPALAVGRVYRYEIRVKAAGREVKREIRFEPGKVTEVDFRPDFAAPVPVAPTETAPRKPYRPLRPSELPPRRVYG